MEYLKLTGNWGSQRPKDKAKRLDEAEPLDGGFAMDGLYQAQPRSVLPSFGCSVWALVLWDFGTREGGYGFGF